MRVLRHALSVLALPFMVVVVIPYWILTTRAAHDTRWTAGTTSAALWHGGGALVFLAGFALFVWCVSLFVRVGRGTLAPWDPTTALVAVGPYSHVRNPMITAVLAMLTGEGLHVGSRRLALWALLVLVINHAYFLLVEEPGLARRFGVDYLRYKQSVPRWLPRIRAVSPRKP